MGYIYKITNNKNNKIYIGQTIKQRPTDRYSQHRYLATHPQQEKGMSYLHKAMNKYGLENFSFEVIEQIDNSQLNTKQQYWIQYYDSMIPNGYNMTEGGEGTQGYSRQQSIEERLKRQQSNKKYYAEHPEVKQQIGKRTKKLWENTQYRQKVTEGVHKFYNQHPDIFKGQNNPFYGKHHTEQSLQKIKEAAKKRQLPIAQLDKDTLETIKVYDGVKVAQRELQVSHGWISKAAKQNKVAYGYRWKFIQKV